MHPSECLPSDSLYVPDLLDSHQEFGWKSVEDSSEFLAREPIASLAMRSVFKKVKVNGEVVSRLEPTSYEQMEQMLDNTSWREAVRTQLQKWEGTNTLGEPYPLSHILALGIEKKDIGRLIWIFKIKHDDQMNWEKDSARLCFEGSHTRPLTDTFSDIARPETIRLMLHKAAVEDAITFQYDWTNAHQITPRPADFVRAVYAPKGLPQFINGERACYLPQTFIQGEPEAASHWTKRLYEFHETWNLSRCLFDRNAFVRFEGDEWLILCVVVDDISGATNSKRLLADFDSHMKIHPVTGGGEIDWLLNTKFVRDRASRTISLSFEARIEGIMMEHLPDEMRRSKYPPTPFNPQLDHLASASEMSLSPERYKKLHRCLAQLLYVGKQGRFELLYVVHRISVSFHKKSKLLEECILYALLFLFGSRKLCLVLGGISGLLHADHCSISAAAD